MPDQPEHDWQNCRICTRNVGEEGLSYFDPATGYHPRTTTIHYVPGTGWFYSPDPDAFSAFLGPIPELGDLENLHRLKDGEVIKCSSLN